MDNFIDHRVTARVSREFRRVVQGKTDIVALDNGDEIRNARWKHKLRQFTANFAMVSEEAQEELSSVFIVAQAMLLLFRFRDHGDYLVKDSPLAVVVGTKEPVQLTKRYKFGPAYSDRMIQAIAKCNVTDAGGNAISGSIDNVLGIFTPFDNWPVGGAKWSGRFDCWVRFASDDFDSTMQQLDISTADVELVERRAKRA